MPEKQPKPERVEIGFSGGQVVAARLADEQLAELRKVVETGKGWHHLTTDDGDIAIDLAQVVFVRAASGDHRIGFTGS